jgi:predicted RNA binding protein YcfA (HicA-like mRNA interferase family)
MASLPTVTADEAIKAFQAAGFAIARTSGSHYTLKKPAFTRCLTIPRHGSRNLKPGLLRAQIRTAELTVEQFVELLG